MPHLESLSVGFRPPESLHDFPDHPNRLLSPLTRVVLPSLTEFRFQVVSEYIEDFVSQIDVPPNREFFRGRFPRQSYAQMPSSCDRWEAQVGRQFPSLRRLGEQGKGQ